MYYRIEHVVTEIEQTHYWKDLNAKRPADVYWLTGERNGKVFESRCATEVEIELYKEIERLRALGGDKVV